VTRLGAGLSGSEPRASARGGRRQRPRALKGAVRFWQVSGSLRLLLTLSDGPVRRDAQAWAGADFDSVLDAGFDSVLDEGFDSVLDAGFDSVLDEGFDSGLESLLAEPSGEELLA